MDIGVLSLIPCAVTIVLALITKRTFEPLIAGGIVGFIMASGSHFLQNWIGGLYGVMADDTTIWLYCVCLPFGSVVALIEKSQGTIGFAEKGAKFANSGRKSLVASWILGIFLFADDYFNALAVGTAMRNLTDKFKVPREMLAYVTNSTGAVVCLVIPFSTWSAFMISQMEGAGACAKGEGTGLYFQSIPFMFYCLATILVVPLIIAGIIPKIGPMRNAYKRAEETGQTIPDTMLERVKFHEEMVKTDGSVKPKAINFVIPMLVLAGVTIGTSDMQWGVLATIVTCLIMYIPQKIMKPGEMFDAILDGMKDMVTPCLIVTGAFLLQAANDKLGMIQYVIDTVAPIMSPAFLPVITFIVVAVLGFCTGCFWGAAAICFPIIIPLAQSIDVNLVLTIGAICSGAGWGSTACFFSDAPTLTCTSTQIANSDYARTVVPMLAVPSAIAVILFTVFGVIMA